MPIRIFELVEEEGQVDDNILHMLEQFEAGLECFDGRDWEGAIAKFTTALRFVPDDGPSIRFIKKCKEFIATPPPANWDGVYTLDMK